MNTKLKEIARVWPDTQPVFSVPHNKKDYNRLVNFLDSLIDEVGNNENHLLTSLMETIGSLIIRLMYLFLWQDIAGSIQLIFLLSRQ